MKAKTAVLGCLIGVVVLAMGYEYSQAQPEAGTPSSKIGVVNIRKVFLYCKRSAKYNAEVRAEQYRIDAEDKKLEEDIKAGTARLSALKRGSSDYLAQLKEVLENQRKREVEKEYNMQRKALKYQRWVEDLFVDVLRETGEVAKQKGLDLVIEKDEVEFPGPSVDSTLMAVRTHKVLYSGGCVDITDEVIARLDKEESKSEN